MRLHLFGGFRARIGSRDVPADVWPTRRAVELVQLLALAEHHRLPREVAIESLWPHLDPEAGAANLRKAAHHARRALGDPQAVVLRSGAVALFPGREVETDVRAFEREASPELYGGELLPDSPYEPWTQEPRERLRARYLEILRERGRPEAVAEADPTDEPAHLELMRSELRQGNPPGAIRWFGRLRSALRARLGAAPGPEAAALHEEAIAGLARAGEELVGREVELAHLSAALRGDEATAATLVLRGAGGVGKSALCRQLARDAEARGWMVVATASGEADPPYAALAAAAERLAEEEPTLLEAVGPKARSVLERLAAPRDVSPAERLTRHQAIGAFRRLLLEAARGAPLAVVLDDAHLADEATLNVLRHLNVAATRPVAIVLAYRPEAVAEGLDAAVAGITRTGRAVELNLEPLGREATAALVAAAAGSPRDERTVERIYELGQGNPFLTVELARSRVIGVPALNQSLREAIDGRFLDLESGTAGSLRRLALAGDSLDPAAAEAAASESEKMARRALDAGLRTGILVADDGRYRFRHELVRRALAERVPPHERPRAHRELARALAAAGAEPRPVGRHWLAGGRPDEATPWLLAAAQRAVDLGAYADALVDLDLALRQDPGEPRALRLRAEALDAVGEREAVAAYTAAAAAAPAAAAGDLRAKKALAMVKLGDPPGALRELEGVRTASLEGNIDRALAFAGAAALGFGDPAVGTERAAEARRLALESSDPTAVTVASWAQAAAAHARGELRESVRADLYDTRALGRLSVSAFDGQLCITQRLLYGARPYDDVIAFASSLEEESERLGAARGLAFAVTIRGEAKLLAGRLGQAEEDLIRGARLHRAIAAAAGESFALQRRAELELHRDHRTEALALLDEALAIARESEVGFHLLDRIHGTLIQSARDPEEALARLDEAEEAVRGPVETCPGCRITLAVPAAIAAARGGDADRGHEWTRACEYLAGQVMRLPAWHAALEEVKGHRCADRATAREHFRAAAAGFAAAGHPLDESRCAALAA